MKNRLHDAATDESFPGTAMDVTELYDEVSKHVDPQILIAGIVGFITLGRYFGWYLTNSNSRVSV